MTTNHPIRRFATLLTIAHHIPGRVRLKLATQDGMTVDQAISDARQFGQGIDRVPGIRSVSLNLLARSCVVEYDPGHIPPAAWQDLVTGRTSPAADSLLASIIGPHGHSDH